MAALSGEPKSKEKAGFSRGREGPWAWPPPCACLFASTPSLAPAQSRWPARRCRRPRGVFIQFRCASPRSARSTPRGTEPAQQNARTRQSPRPPHPGAQSGGREGPPVRLCAKGGQRPQSGAWSCGPWPACLQNFTQPSPELHSAIPCSPGSVRPRRVVMGKTVPAPYVEL